MFLLNRSITISQSAAVLFCAIYLGIFLNIPIYIKRLVSLGNKLGYEIATFNIMLESLIVISSIVLFLLAISFMGNIIFRIITSIIIVLSATASFYMIFYHVVIGYGIIISILTTDIDLSKEMIGLYLIGWVSTFGIAPIIYMNLYCRIAPSSYVQIKNKKGFIRLALLSFLCIVTLIISLHYFDQLKKASRNGKDGEIPSQAGVIFHSYVPSNWLVGLGVHILNVGDEKLRSNKLFDPARHYTYMPLKSNDDTFLVFIIGESARYDHMSIFGYERNTNEYLKKEKNVVAIKGVSSNTATKLSLRTMFVRDGGYDKKTLLPKEENIFSVLKSLGFSSDLFAMQSEVWFYNSVKSDFYKIREVIASETNNTGKPIDDMLLIPEIEQSINRHPKGKHLIILHTKGQHYLYTNRYPRNFAIFTPECMGVDSYCDKQSMINSYDNSMLYTDYFLSNIIKTLKNKKALLFYTSDHGESIDENSHFHGTPKEVAPPEQRMVPFIIWASSKYLAVPENRSAFERLKAHQGEVRRHEEIYDTLLGCLGYTSPDNGIIQRNNWCQ